MLADLSPQQLAFFAILAGAFALLLTERLRNDLVAVLLQPRPDPPMSIASVRTG